MATDVDWHPQNFLAAYYWLSLAARKLDVAAPLRDGAAKHLSADDKAKADKALAEWKPTPVPYTLAPISEMDIMIPHMK
jgi:hypothetical protein